MSTIKLTDSIPIEKPTLSNFCDIFTDWHDKYLLLLFEISLEVTLALGRRSRKILWFIFGDHQIHHMFVHSLTAMSLVVAIIIRNNSLRFMIANVRAVWLVAIVISRTGPNCLTDGWNNIAIFWILTTLLPQYITTCIRSTALCFKKLTFISQHCRSGAASWKKESEKVEKHHLPTHAQFSLMSIS